MRSGSPRVQLGLENPMSPEPFDSCAKANATGGSTILQVEHRLLKISSDGKLTRGYHARTNPDSGRVEDLLHLSITCGFLNSKLNRQMRFTLR